MRWPPDPTALRWHTPPTAAPIGMPAPDPAEPCCDMAWQTDGKECTCWVPVFVTYPADEKVVAEGPPVVRLKSCDDCAYRFGSRERTENNGELPSFPPGEPFYCHTGMPRVGGYQHPALPYVTVLDPAHADYRPLVRGNRAFQADGTPAQLCAGWAATTWSRPYRDEASQ